MYEENVTIKQGLSGGWIAFIVIVVLIGGIAIGYWYANNKSDEEKISVTPTPTATSSTTKSPTASPTTTATTSWKNVNFSDYGFSLELTDNWQGYRYEEQNPNDGSAVKWIRFFVPTSDPDYESAELPGYTNPFVISVYTPAQWAAVDMNEPHDVYIGENDDYVIAWSRWQACPEDLCEKINEADLAKIKDSITVE